MSLHRCIFGVHFDADASIETLEQRVQTLAAWYASNGERPAIEVQLPAPGTLVGQIDLDGIAHDGGPFVWGGPTPQNLSAHEEIVNATDSDLRTLGSTVAVIATSLGRVRIATGVGGVAGIYCAERDGIVAWSSHAVAAGWLSTAAAAIDWSCVPELLALGFVSGDRTLITGVSAVADGSVIDIDRGIVRRSYWPAKERWVPVPETDARASCEELLLDRLPGRVTKSALVLGLTAGLDSQVIALALREGGVDFATMTAGDPAWRDVKAASRLAAAIEVPHAHAPIDWHTDDEAVATMTELVRWSDGTVLPALARDSLGDMHGMPFVTGGGGEVGRAFYYKMQGHSQSVPSVPRMLSLMDPSGAIVGARRSARRVVINAVAQGIRAAEELGYEGWRALDVYYAEQRLRKWGRSTLPKTRGSVIIGFGDPPLLAALVSLPLRDRMDSRFHRDFLAKYGDTPAAPIVAPHSPPGRAPTLIRKARRRLSSPHRSKGPWAGHHRWQHVPTFHELVIRSTQSPSIRGVMGVRWCRQQRDSFMVGELAGTVSALRCAAITTFAEGLHELESTRINGSA